MRTGPLRVKMKWESREEWGVPQGGFPSVGLRPLAERFATG